MDILTERTANILLDDDEDYDDQDGPIESRVHLKEDRRLTKSKSCRRRRRSSARFLQLSAGDTEDDDEQKERVPHDNLGEVYQNAIRMNAENRINASNSWNLNLIDHMDRFLMSSGQTNTVALEDTLGPVTGINFTKASCTLDASVKIYSYRVDDVHLTSYKVLANLNRTDSGKSKNTEGEGERTVKETSSDARDQRRVARTNAETLETNLVNINIHKLDAAFDIDPLFHKMSKTFDEGGAKGLLLANLGVSTHGCNIVFDSTLDDGEIKVSKDNDTSVSRPTAVDVSTLTAKVEASLHGQSMQQLPLVPQLAMLRSEYAILKDEGFVEKYKPSRRYEAPKEAEVEADRSIHVEAIERSRASQADIGRSLMVEQDDDSFVTTDDDGGYAPVDFGGGDDNDDDEDDDEDHKERFPVAFIHDGDHRFSSESFQTTYEASQPPSQATVLLDAIAAGEIPGSQSNYEFFNKKALEAIQGNQWAGAAHWKKIQPKRDLTTSEPEKADASKVLRKRKGKATKTRNTGKITVEISQISSSIINEALQKPSKGRKGNDSLQMTKAAIAKASKNENILPFDAGIKVEDFTSLFLRPKTNVRDFSSSAHLRVPPRQVGFGGVETWGNHDDNSFGADAADEGTGFDFGGDYDDDPGDFVIPELEGVRKVEKVKVGYATVAKKVDVKRLKHDLWEELERTFQQRGQLQAEVFNDDTLDEKMEALDDSENAEQLSETFGIRQTPLSFQDTVREMQATQSQPDVTLPFYFICILHLANEKGLALETMGLGDFIIHSS